MGIERGQAISARFPHASGTRGKKRPVVVVQSEAYNKRLRHAVVAQSVSLKGSVVFWERTPTI